jgi:hypothetical protein
VVLDAVTQVHHTIAESPLVQQLKIDADVVWEERIRAYSRMNGGWSDAVCAVSQ